MCEPFPTVPSPRRSGDQAGAGLRDAAPRRGGPATFLALSGSSVCVHRVRELLTGHGLQPAGPRAVPDLTVVVSDDPADLVALVSASTRTRPSSRHLVLSHGPLSDAHVLSAVRVGADGCLPLDLPPAAMRASLDSLLRGEAALPRAVVAAVLAEVRLRPGRTVRRDDGRVVELTEREWQVLELLTHGRSTSEIAARMHVGEATVRGYVRTAVGRLRATGRGDALRLFRGGLPAAGRDLRLLGRHGTPDAAAVGG